MDALNETRVAPVEEPEPSEQPGEPGRPARKRRKRRGPPFPILFAARTARIVTLTVAFGVMFGGHRLVSRDSGPRILRWYLQSAGAAFVKLGQILAMRYDLLPARYCDELLKLLDSLPPIPFEVVTEVIETDLGRSIAECYAEIEPEALAAASIAQVHGARLHSGESVVVKVVRPGMARRFRIDFVYMRLGARFMDRFGPFGELSLQRLIGELIQATKEELDFRREARNVYQMHEAMLDDDVDHYSPALVPELCGRLVLTMERIEGVPVNTILAALEAGDEVALARWAEQGIDPRRTAAVLMRSVLEQSMRHRLFHADPHAANLIVMPGGTLAWIDFGMLGWLDERLWKAQFRMREAVVEGNVYAAYLQLLSTLEPLPPIDLSQFEAEVTDLFRDWTVASYVPTASLLEKSSGYVFLRIFDAVRRAGLRLPVGLARLYRSIFVADIVMLKLDPGIDWVPIMRRFVRDEVLRQARHRLTEGVSASTLNAAVTAYVEGPSTIAALSEWVQSGLPGVGREYRVERGRAERVTALLVSYARAALVIGTLVVLGSRTLAPALFPGSGWDHLGDRLDSSWLLLIASGVFGTVLFGRILHEFRRAG